MKKKILLCFFIFYCIRLNAFVDVGSSIFHIVRSKNFNQESDAPEYNWDKFKEAEINIKILQSEEFSNKKLSDFILHTDGFLVAYQNNRNLGIFAFVKSVDNDLVFYYDCDGDGRIDEISNSYFLPPWILFKADLPRENPQSFLNVCNDIYEVFNSTNKLNIQKIESLNLMISEYYNTDNNPNYDLYYAYLFYLTSLEKSTTIEIIKSIENQLKQKFNINTPIPLFKLYIGEYYFLLGQYNLAVVQFRKLKNADHASKIADFYMACMSDIKNNNSDATTKFEKQYPNMWILEKENKELLNDE